jgi:hypothetical protein
VLRSISQLDNFISQTGVFRAANRKQASSSLFTKKHKIWNKPFQGQTHQLGAAAFTR